MHATRTKCICLSFQETPLDGKGEKRRMEMNRTVNIVAGEEAGPADLAVEASRSRVYSLLSALFLKEATPDLLAVLTGEEVAEALWELGSDMGRILHGPQPADLLEELAEEYAALFIVPGGLPPYESVRLHGMLNQKPAWETEEFYRRCGLVIREESGILPDHLGMELEFMGYLAGKEADARLNREEQAAGQWLGLQSEFFREHLDGWAFGFLEDLRRYAAHPFYKEIGSLTARFLEVEKELLADGRDGAGDPDSSVE
jgi:TorA maturation chaperone TorD